MGQQEVYDFLTKNPDHWYTSKEISEELAVSIGSVTMSLKKLRKTNIIKYRNTGKRNTFQYMAQSEPIKLIERTVLLADAPAMPQPIEQPKLRVKIKPKIVHQHTYLSGQTFYGVIRPKEEVDAIEKARSDIEAAAVAKQAAEQRIMEKRAENAKVMRSRSSKSSAPKTKTLKTKSGHTVVKTTSARTTAQKRTVKAPAKKTAAKKTVKKAAKKTVKKAVKKTAKKPVKKAVKKTAKKAAKRSRR